MAADFIRIIEEGMEKSKTTFTSTPTTPTETKKTTAKTTTKKSSKKPLVEEDEDAELMEQLRAVVAQAEEKSEVVEDEAPFDTEEIDDIFEEEDVVEDEMITLDDARMGAIRNAFKAANATQKAEVKKHLIDYNNKLCDTMKQSDVDAIESVLGLSDEV
jgi:hypothetical protein